MAEDRVRWLFAGINGYTLRIDVKSDVVVAAILKSATGKAHSGSVRLPLADGVKVSEWLAGAPADGERFTVDGSNGYTLRIEVTDQTLKAVTLRTATGHTSGIAKLDVAAAAALRGLDVSA